MVQNSDDYYAKRDARMKKLAIFGGGGVGLLIVLVLLFNMVIGYAPQGYYTLVYNQIPSNSFQQLVMPGQGLFWKGFFAVTYQYPATQRTYIVSKNPNEGDVQGVDTLTAKCGDSNSVVIESALTFELLPETVQKFHEQIGLKRQAWTAEGWTSFLEQYVRQGEKECFQTVLKPYTAVSASGESKVTSDTAASGMIEIGNTVADALQQEYDTYMDGKYVRVIRFQLNDLTPADPNIVAAIAKRTAAQQDVQTAQQELAAAKYRAEKNVAIAESLQTKGGMTAVLDEAVKSGKVTFWVLNGQNLTVGAPSNVAP